MGSIHLSVVELKGDGQLIVKPFAAVFAPDDKRIVENAAIHADCAVYLGINNSGGADDHTVCGEVSIPAIKGYLCRIFARQAYFFLIPIFFPWGNFFLVNPWSTQRQTLFSIPYHAKTRKKRLLRGYSLNRR